MPGRRAVFGLCVLCALAISALAAQGAAATGQTAWTCTATAPSLDFNTDHCVPGETGTKFGHRAINEETHAKLSNEKTSAPTTGKTNWIFEQVVAATALQLTATGLEGVGTLKNEVAAGEMRASAASNANGLVFTGVTVTKPAGKGCKVYEDVTPANTEGTEGVVKTKPLEGRTIVTGTTHEVQIEPQTGTVFATFWITCTDPSVPAALLGTWELTGYVKCPTHGATIECIHSAITTQNTLKGRGAKAGISGKATITAGKLPESEPTSPISVTTE